MKLKPGVNPLRMRPEIVLAVIVANEVYALHGRGLVVTSICDGVHSARSYHYAGLAIDCRTRYFDSAEQINDVAEEIRARLGEFYDVVIESDHLHIEFDENRAIDAANA
ncbi:MAG: hypothetical protein KDA17_05910 [Candidatus Saccharibacteria bacterium]|nr:hypothetical protein [Candidatus Saccharibacteria bacterium]